MIELRVSDARHWTFCPRVIWHREMMAVPVKPTGKMQLGLEAEAALARFERRRSARRYGLDRAERRFDVVLESSRLGVRGVCDLVLDVPPTVEYWPTLPPGVTGIVPIELEKPRRLFPVDVKRTEGGVSRHHMVQLAGYAMLLEEQEGLAPGTVDRGFIYVVPDQEVVAVRIDEELRKAFEKALTEIRVMLMTERFPPPTRHRRFCPECEYVNFCGDVL